MTDVSNINDCKGFLVGRAGLEPATPCESWVLSPVSCVRRRSINPGTKGRSFVGVPDSSPRFIGVTEVVTEVEIPAQRLLPVANCSARERKTFGHLRTQQDIF
jgi:hypothetical protein